MEYYTGVLKKYAEFNGRARRKEYWMFFLFNIMISIVISIFSFLIGDKSGTLGFIYLLATFIPNLAVSIRRLHDINKSGWWLLIGIIPIIGIIVLIIFHATDSAPGENKYGPNPKGVAAA